MHQSIKVGIILALILATTIIVCSNANAFPGWGKMLDITEEVYSVCSAKHYTATFHYDNRDLLTEEEALFLVDKEWKDTWSENPAITHATYLEMQRIVRDLYRKQSTGEYRITMPVDEFAEKEMDECLISLHY